MLSALRWIWQRQCSRWRRAHNPAQIKKVCSPLVGGIYEGLGWPLYRSGGLRLYLLLTLSVLGQLIGDFVPRRL